MAIKADKAIEMPVPFLVPWILLNISPYHLVIVHVPLMRYDSLVPSSHGGLASPATRESGLKPHLISHKPRPQWTPALREKSMLALTLAIVAIFWLTTIRSGHVWGDDFAMYVHHAKNLVEGYPYEDVKLIPNPYNPLYAPTTTPPLFPLLLVPVYALAGLDVTAFKIIPVLAFLLALLPIFRLARFELPYQSSLAIVLVLGFAPYFWDFKDEVRPDYVFLLFTYSALLLLFTHYHAPQNLNSGRAGSPLAIGVVLFLGYATRPVALVLLACALLLDLHRHRRLTRFAVTLILTFSVLTIGQHLLFPGTGYLAQVDVSARVPVSNALTYVADLILFWANGHSGMAMFLLFAVTTTLAIGGYIVRLRRRRTLLELYFGLYLLTLVFWPMYQNLRYLIPLLPLYFLYMFVGLDHLASLLPSTLSRRLFPLLLATMLFNFAATYTTMNLRTVSQGLADPDTQELLAWVRSSTPEDARIVFYRARLLSLFTGRPAATLHEPEHAETIGRYWEEIGANYLIISYFDADFWQDYVRANASRLSVVFRNEDFTAYKIRHGESNSVEARHPIVSLPTTHRYGMIPSLDDSTRAGSTRNACER